MSKYLEMAERLEDSAQFAEGLGLPEVGLTTATVEEAAALLREADARILAKDGAYNYVASELNKAETRIAELEEALREIAEKDWLRGEAQKHARAALEGK